MHVVRLPHGQAPVITLRPDPFTGQLISAALQDRTAQPQPYGSRHMPAEPLTVAEMRILKLLPASTYPQIATTLFISRRTVKAHMRSIYQKLGVTSRLEAIERALELRLL
jgi:LuxR family transcriptional regulator, maltose regulon positive regulatory protein